MALPTLTLGSFNLNDALGLQFIGAAVMASGTSRGNPVPIEVAVQSWLQDGSIVATQGYDNREVTMRVRLGGANLTAVAALEAALVAELNKPNTLTWTPNGAPASVFDVVTSSLDIDDTYDSADIVEGQHNLRFYRLRLVCAAFVRSTTETVVAALAASGTTTTLVDDGSATTGWTGAVNGSGTAVSVSSGAVGLTSPTVAGTVSVALTRTGSISTSATPYLMVDWRGMANNPLTAVGDGVALERVSQANSPTSGYTRTWFKVAAASVSAVTLTQGSYASPVPQARPLYIDNINRTDVRPSLGSARQLLRTIAVSGSARTSGRLAIEHPTNALGYTIAYVWSGGAEGTSPPLRPYRISGGTVTTDATKISGAYENIKSTTIIYDIPLSQVTPGIHLVMLKLVTNSVVSGTTTTLTYTSSTRLNGVRVSPLETNTVTVPNTTLSGAAYTVATRLMLPSQSINPNSGGFQRITLSTTTTLADLSIDEAWLFNTSVGQLNVVWSDGSGTASLGGPANRIYLEPATVDVPRPMITMGFNADRSDARYPQEVAAWQQPQFVPPGVKVFTVTPYTTDANVTLAYYPRWHSHAAS